MSSMSIKSAAIVLSAVSLLGAVSLQAQSGAYKVLKTAKTGGAGGFDYVYADTANRKLYVPRMGDAPRASTFDLDSLAPGADVAEKNGHGVAVDTKYNHGFSSSSPVSMWDAKTLAPIKTIDVQGRPDGLIDDPYNNRVYILSHAAPNVTVIDAKDGNILGTFDLGGAPEQAATDNDGHMYIDVEDKGSIAVVDTKSMKVTSSFSLAGKGDGCAGLALDTKNHVLFAACREPNVMVMLNAKDGKILSTLPIGKGTDGAVFNPKTMEAFSSNSDGTLTIIKETGPTSFMVEQNLNTMARAKTLTLDTKTGNVYLIAAEFKPAPPAAAGQRQERPSMIPDSFTIITVGK